MQQTEKAEKLKSSPVLSFFVLWREKKNTTKRHYGNLGIALFGNFSLSVRKQKDAKIWPSCILIKCLVSV